MPEGVLFLRLSPRRLPKVYCTKVCNIASSLKASWQGRENSTVFESFKNIYYYYCLKAYGDHLAAFDRTLAESAFTSGGFSVGTQSLHLKLS